MRLTLAERKAITRKLANRYARSPKAEKSKILDDVCELCDWSRDHAPRALKQALTPTRRRKRPVRVPTYDAEVVAALKVMWQPWTGRPASVWLR